MPNWDDPRVPRRDDERDRWRQDRSEREAMRGRRDWQGDERRSFDERAGRFGRGGGEPGQEPWRRDRYAARYDQDRAGYRDYEDAARLRDDSAMRSGERYGYAGQGYGLEGQSGVSGGLYPSGRTPRGAGWGFERDAERRRSFDRNDPGVGQSQAGSGRQAQSHPDYGLDPEYVSWRDEQMRAHDRDYEDWRRERHRQYDEQYRQYRSERQRHFGEAFHQWRSQRGMVGGVPDTSIGSVGQGQGGYGDMTGIPGGYNAASAYDRPTGYLDPPGHLAADPAMQQVGGETAEQSASPTPGGDRTPEFGREPSQVQAAAEGGVQGHERRRRDDKDGDSAKGDEAKRH